MSRTRNMQAIAIAAATLLTAVPLVLAQPPDGAHRHGPGAGGGPGWLMGRLADKLDLSKEQRETIRGLFETHRDDTAPLREDLRGLEGAVEESIHAEPFDEEAVRAVAQQVADVRVELAVARARLAQEVHQVLTPEQREQAAEMRERRKDFRGEFGGKRGFRRHHGRRGLGG